MVIFLYNLDIFAWIQQLDTTLLGSTFVLYLNRLIPEPSYNITKTYLYNFDPLKPHFMGRPTDIGL